jgi:hypothetical protein
MLRTAQNPTCFTGDAPPAIAENGGIRLHSIVPQIAGAVLPKGKGGGFLPFPLPHNLPVLSPNSKSALVSILFVFLEIRNSIKSRQ